MAAPRLKPITSITQLLTDKKLHGKVTLLDSAEDTLAVVMLENGDDPAKVTDKSWNDAFNRIKYHVRMDAAVTVCEDIKKVIVASGKLPPEKVNVIYAGVDLARFDPEKTDGERVRREWGAAAGEKLLVQPPCLRRLVARMQRRQLHRQSWPPLQLILVA